MELWLESVHKHFGFLTVGVCDYYNFVNFLKLAVLQYNGLALPEGNEWEIGVKAILDLRIKRNFFFNFLRLSGTQDC